MPMASIGCGRATVSPPRRAGAVTIPGIERASCAMGELYIGRSHSFVHEPIRRVRNETLIGSSRTYIEVDQAHPISWRGGSLREAAYDRQVDIAPRVLPAAVRDSPRLGIGRETA